MTNDLFPRLVAFQADQSNVIQMPVRLHAAPVVESLNQREEFHLDNASEAIQSAQTDLFLAWQSMAERLESGRVLPARTLKAYRDAVALLDDVRELMAQFEIPEGAA